MISKVPRSSEWPKAEKAHLILQPACVVCGKTDAVQVHHRFPFSVGQHLGFPSTETWEPNLITLCETEEDKPEDNHHLLIGHDGAFECTNLNVDEDVIKYKNLTHIQLLENTEYLESKKKRLPKPDDMTQDQKDFCVQWLKDHYPDLPEFKK